MLTRPAYRAATLRSGGFTLLETLVSLVVFSVGMLGVAVLQTTAKKANFDAVQRTYAAQLGYDLLERMRANDGAVESYLATIGGATRPDPAIDCSAVTCTPPEMAAYDLWEWERAVDGFSERRGSEGTGGLSTPTVCVTGPAGGVAGLYQVTLAWRGLTAIPNGVADACGAGSGRYGDGNQYRRMMTIQTFLDPAS